MFIPPGENIIETRKCRISGEEFVITDKDRELYELFSLTFDGQKKPIPMPTLCPRERQMHRMIWRNYDHFYKNICALTGKEIISTYRPGTPYKVANLESWWSNEWNPGEYGQEIDFSRPFFPQFRSLDEAVLHLPLAVNKCENSNFTNFSLNNRNCYLCIRIADCENCFYSFLLARCKFCYDCCQVDDSEYLYECIRTIKSYHCLFCTDCENCTDCHFLKDCSSCRDCFGSCNLKNARYVFNNVQLTEEEYHKKLSAAFKNFSDVASIRNDFLHFAEKFPKRFFIGFRNENVSGNNLFLCGNVVYGFDTYDCENMRYVFGSHSSKDSIDISFDYLSQKCLEVCGVASGYNILFSNNCQTECRDLIYCKDCMNATTDCFGLISLKKAQHCILNKAYSQQEYETTVAKLIDHMQSCGEWGEYFPVEIAPYAYNESSAQVHFPLTREEVSHRGWHWYEEEKSLNEAGMNPFPISEYDEKKVGYAVAQKNIDILLASTLTCPETGKQFKIMPAELAFYIENHLPIPRRHPSCRLQIRMKQTLPPELHDRSCAECGQPFLTSYAPERPEKILCEDCYRKLVY